MRPLGIVLLVALAACGAEVQDASTACRDWFGHVWPAVDCTPGESCAAVATEDGGIVTHTGVCQ